MATPLHLAVALEGAGWHPAAWREPAARPTELFTAKYWLDQVRTAEQGLLDFVTIEDSFSLDDTGRPPDGTVTDRVSGRLDAVLIAARVAPATTTIGLVPTALVTHTEPFHLSKAVATLDHVSSGRAGVRIQVSPHAQEAEHFGRRTIGAAERLQLLDEAADYVEVMRRLWDSWEDDAEIRDAVTGRFLDRDKVHYIDFVGPFFSVKGPSIVPRPPQGQPLVTALAHGPAAYRLAATSADVVLVTPHTQDEAATIVAQVRDERARAQPDADDLLVFADVVVFLDNPTESGASRKRRLDGLSGTEYSSDALVFTGTAAALADQLAQWQQVGITGFRLRPGALPDDLLSITGQLVPALRSRGLFRDAYGEKTLRERLHLQRPVDRYATHSATQEVAR